MTGKLRVESLEDRWNLSTLLGTAPVVGDPVPTDQFSLNYAQIRFEAVEPTAELVALSPVEEPAQIDYFLKIEGIDAEASPKLFLTCATGQHIEPESPDGFADSSDGAGIHVPIKIKHGL